MNNLIEKIIWILTINFMLNACSSVAKDPKNRQINKLDSSLSISASEAKAIGKRIWINECGGTVEGLTSWNKGEYFASLGIGHFIGHLRIFVGHFVGHLGFFFYSIGHFVGHLRNFFTV